MPPPWIAPAPWAIHTAPARHKMPPIIPRDHTVTPLRKRTAARGIRTMSHGGWFAPESTPRPPSVGIFPSGRSIAASPPYTSVVAAETDGRASWRTNTRERHFEDDPFVAHDSSRVGRHLERHRRPERQ